MLRHFLSAVISASHCLLVLSALLASHAARADSPSTGDNTLLTSAYIEAYYIHDLDQHSSGKRPGFTYSHNISGKPSINLAFVRSALNTGQVRANLALGSGSYMRANYGAEPDDLQKILEANIGFKLLAEYNLWLDIGVFPSHIGFESAIGRENWTVTRSMLADNSPYFETGAKLTYTSEDGQWFASGLLLNGWQRMQRPDGNTTPALGHQLTYKPSARITLNSSSFIGNDASDRDRKMRYFHNAYAQFQLNDALSLIAGVDIGAQKRYRNSSQYQVWYAPIVIAQYAYSDTLRFTARAEYYADREGVIVNSDTPHGFRTASYSGNVDVNLSKAVELRAELRKYHSRDRIFGDSDRLRDDSLIFTTALCINF